MKVLAQKNKTKGNYVNAIGVYKTHLQLFAENRLPCNRLPDKHVTGKPPPETLSACRGVFEWRQVFFAAT